MKYDDILKIMKEIHDKKSHDYATSEDPLLNLRACEIFGKFPAWKGVVIRLSDKMGRLWNAFNGKLMKNESIEDTLIDIANYAILCLILFKDYEEKKNTKKLG